jgi:sporulation protein YlmC with PRC-barrel domain
VPSFPEEPEGSGSKGDAVMSTKQGQGFKRICSIVFVVVAFLSFFSFPARGAEVKSEKIRRPGGEINLQEGFRASKIIDQTVKNDQGEVLGEVDDLIMSRNGKIKKVILSVGGYLGVGYRLVAVDFKSLRISKRGDIIHNITKQQLEKYPEFNYRNEGLYGNYFPPYPTYSYPYNPGYYYPENPTYPPYPPYPPYGKPYSRFPEKTKKGKHFYPWTWEYFPERLQVSALLNRAVWNDEGDTVGDLDDLIISLRGKVEKIILSVGGFFGIQAKLVALPFKPLKITDMGTVYNVTEQELKNLPEFSYEKE